MEGLIIDLPFEKDKTYHLTVYSDLHDDARECAHDILKKHMDARAKLPNALFFGIGDISNFIMPGPDKRSTPSTPVPELADEDEYIDKQVERQAEMYKDYPWVAMGIGNHCTSVINHHYTNPVRRLVDKISYMRGPKGLPIKYAGYSGFARYRFQTKSSKGGRCQFNHLYHHGAWGGVVIKGLAGALRWADRHQAGRSWRLMTYGHNHQLHAHLLPNMGMNDAGRIVDETQIVANTGTFQRGATQGVNPSYSEIRGYPPVALAAPLIRITPRHDVGALLSCEIGDC